MENLTWIKLILPHEIHDNVQIYFLLTPARGIYTPVHNGLIQNANIFWI